MLVSAGAHFNYNLFSPLCSVFLVRQKLSRGKGRVVIGFDEFILFKALIERKVMVVVVGTAMAPMAMNRDKHERH